MSSAATGETAGRPAAAAGRPAAITRGRTGATAAFFDLDKTLISRSSTLAFAPSFYRHGLINRVEAVRGAVFQLMFRLRGADHQRMEMIKTQLTTLCQGWSADRVTEIVTTNLAEIIGPLIYPQARHLLAEHKAAGRDVFIVSTSAREMVGPIGTLLGASGVIATRMAVTDGHYTGELDFYAYGEAKAHRMRQLADERGYDLEDCFAYSDSVTDLPMLEAVGYPHAVNPDRELRRVARDRGWPVLAFAAAGAAAAQYKPRNM